MCKNSMTKKIQHVELSPPNKHSFCGSDNAANQSKTNYHFSWMLDYVEEDHGLQTVQQIFTAEQHGKGENYLL